jgi:hypothetical protein
VIRNLVRPPGDVCLKAADIVATHELRALQEQQKASDQEAGRFADGSKHGPLSVSPKVPSLEEVFPAQGR